MLDQLINFQDLYSALQGLLSGQASMTTYIIIALIPVCISVAIREMWCWFNKQSKLVSKMERVEKQLIKTNQLLENLGKVLKEERQPSSGNKPETKSKEFIPTTPNDYSKAQEVSQEDLRVEPKSLGDRKFSL